MCHVPHATATPRALILRPSSTHLPGPAETLWDGGMFQVELVFPPDFPDAPPYVHFLTPMFHPHISPLGVPYLRSLIMWNTLEPRDKSVTSLLTALQHGQTRRPASGRAGHPRFEAPSRWLRAALLLLKQSLAAWAPQRSLSASLTRCFKRLFHCVLTSRHSWRCWPWTRRPSLRRTSIQRRRVWSSRELTRTKKSTSGR